MTDSSQPRRTGDLVSIDTLAVELNTHTGAVLAYARRMNIRARDGSHRLTPHEAEAITTYYGLTGGTLPVDGPVETLPGLMPADMRPEFDPMRAAVEETLGVPEHKRHTYRQGRTRRSDPFALPAPPLPVQPAAPKPAKPTLTGLAAEISRVRPELPDTAAKAVAKVWTEQYGLTDEQTIAWLENGLRTGDGRIATELASYGVEPYHLSLIIRKESVLVRLLDNRLTPYRIAELLKQEGQIKAA